MQVRAKKEIIKHKVLGFMNKENTSKLWKIIQETGDYLLGQLPEHPNHPKGRNPYAHVAISAIDIGLPIEFVNFRD